MSNLQSPHEDLVLHILESSSRPLTLKEITEQLPQLSWNQVFLAIDALSRRGGIILKRQGFEYEISASRVV
jgi:hypothetical protein